jgi:hypothetical protein
MMSFPGSTLLLDNPWCGSLRDTLASPVNSNNDDDNNSNSKKSFGGFLRHQADHLCLSGDQEGNDDVNDDIRDDDSLTDRHQPKATTSQDKNANPTSALFARALVSEVTNNPNTMTPKLMAEREKRLLKAQDAARKQQQQLHNSNGSEASANIASGKPVGAPGGIGQASFLGSLAYVLGATASPTNSDTPKTTATGDKTSILPPNSIQENRAQAASNAATPSSSSKYSVTIGLSLSRRHSTQGHPDTVTRQTAFDFNELQDRQYKYVSSTDSSGWMAGGGERGGSFMLPTPSSADYSQGANSDDLPEDFEGSPKPYQNAMTVTTSTTPKAASTPTQHQVKIAAPDTVHIPIIQIDADSPAAVDAIIGALARGEVFIPHMAVLPEALSVNGISPPDLVVRFGCERNEDVPPEEWPNWCLEFMHNQLYEYFFHLGARWTKRPFHITLAKKVRWKTVKHMNRYFAHAERVIDAWREKGPQYLDPQLSYIEGGATPEEVGRPHGIYLMRNGIPTNYFPPNFDPPYTTKMTRSLLLNVLGKSWNKQRREWSGDPIPRLITPAVLMATMCGCADPTPGFLATEVTQVSSQPIEHSNISEQRVVTHDDMLSSHKGNDQLEGTGVSSKPSTETFRTMEGDPVFAPMLQSQQQQQQQTADTFVEHRQGSVESIQLTESPARRQGGDVDEAPTTTNEAQNDEDHAQKMSKSIPVFGKDNSPLTAASMMLSPHGDGSVLSPFGQGFVDDDEERVAAAEAYPFDDDNNVREEKKMADEPLNGHLPYIKQQQHPGYVDHHHQTAPLLSGREADPPSPGPHRTREATLAELVSTDALVTPDLFAESKLESKGSGTLGRGPTPERLRILPIETRHQVTADEQAMSPSVLSESDDDESGAFFHEQLTTPKSELPQLSSQIADTAVASSDILELNSTTASSSTVAHLNLSPAKLVQREFERKMAREGKQLLNGSSPDGGYGSPSVSLELMIKQLEDLSLLVGFCYLFA